MRYQTLGRTGLDVSIAGLGCGGPSRLGTARGKDLGHAASLVRQAVELGVNVIDTARYYGTEQAVGLALKDLDRDRLVLSTKGTFARKGVLSKLVPASTRKIEQQLDTSLKTLGVETIDIYHVHALIEDQIAPLLDKVLPVLERAKRAGKVRHLAVSERFNADPGHRTLARLMDQTDAFDVLMVGFNLLNPSARRRVFAKAVERGVGIEVMFAVRKSLSQPEHLRQTLAGLAERGQIDAGLLDDDPLGFLIDEDTPTVMDAAYRFCAHEPGVHTVLFGTGSPEHLRENTASLNKGPLSAEKLERLDALFGEVDSVSGG